VEDGLDAVWRVGVVGEVRAHRLMDEPGVATGQLLVQPLPGGGGEAQYGFMACFT
jgi:hypothetical protein